MMSRAYSLIVAVAFVLTPPAALGQDVSKKDATAEMLAKLRKPVNLAPGEDLRLGDLVDEVSARHGVTMVLNHPAVSEVFGGNPAEMMIKMPKAKGLALGTLVRKALADQQLTLLVRKSHLEVVPLAYAAKETKNARAEEGENVIRLAQPLVSAIYKERPFNEAIADLAEEFDLTVVVAPQAGDNKAGFINARLLNVPADKAIELLALQADLRVIKKGNTFFVTGRDHAADLFNEQFEREQRKTELDRLKNAPYNLPVPPPAPKQ